MASFQSPQHGWGAGELRPAAGARANLAVIVLTLLGMTYNAWLAIINAHVMNISFAIAAAVEIVILAAGILMALRAGISRNENNILYFFALFIVLTLAISLFNQRIFIDGFRNMMIIVVFVCLGRQANEQTVKKMFLWASIIVLAGLIYELVDLDGYAALFKPAQYFASSRGIAEFEYDETGLFKNTMGFEGRFSYGIFTGPRTSSLFLEQVSLANYAAVLCILLLSLWPRMGRSEKALHVATILLIVTSNNTRATSLLLLVSFAGYYLYPRLPRYANAVAAPLFLLVGIIAFHLAPNAHEDDFVGRTSWTGRHLTNMDPADYFGLNLDKLEHLWDSGYPWLITSTSVFGLLAFWLFVTFVIPQKTAAQMRCAYGVTLYIFMNMLVSGNATFSIKVSAALWLLIGLMSGNKLDAAAPAPAALPRHLAPSRLGKPLAYALTLRQYLRASK